MKRRLCETAKKRGRYRTDQDGTEIWPEKEVNYSKSPRENHENLYVLLENTCTVFVLIMRSDE